MPIEFIPNQPVVFENPIGDYSCLNNDTKVYGPLMQLGDEMCIQWKMTPCGFPLCEPDMYVEGDSVTLSAWSVAGGWTSGSTTTLTFNGGTDSVATNNLGTLTLGAVYKVSFTVTNISGAGVLYVKSSIGQTIGIINTLQDTTGDYTFYFIADINPFSLRFEMDVIPLLTANVVITTIAVQQWTECWQDDLDSGFAGWSYDYDTVTQQGRFCSNANANSLINTNALLNPNYHGITFVISNCTQGGLEVYVDGGTTPIGTTSGNGQFTFYGVPGVNSLIFTKVGNFDGCISQVVVNDYGVIGDYDITFENEDATVTSSIATPTAYDDRLVWCGNWNTLTWTVNGTPDLDPTCGKYYTKIYDPCDDVTHTSVNLINYDPNGHECTKFVEAWNDGYAFGFYFGDVNAPDFKLKQRLRVLAFNPVYRNSGEEYLYSSVQTVRSYAQSQKARTAWFDYVDEYCHDTIRTQLLSQKLTIEGVSFYFPTEDYEPEWNDRGKYNLAQSRVTLFHELSTFGSTCGIIANPFCPPTQQAAIITQVSAKVTADYLSLGLPDSDVCVNYDEFDVNGNYITNAWGVSCHDLTVSTAGLYTSLKNIIDAFYGTSVSGTVNYNAGTFTLTIDLQGVINNVQPIKSLIIYLVPSTGTASSSGVHVPIYFS